MVITFADHDAETPAGSPVAVPIPVAPVVVCVKFVNAVLIQSVGDEEAAETVLSGFTVIVPDAFVIPHPPVNGILYVKIPLTVGVPLMVITFADQVAETPEGSPDTAPIPVAPVVVWVIFVIAF